MLRQTYLLRSSIPVCLCKSLSAHPIGSRKIVGAPILPKLRASYLPHQCPCHVRDRSLRSRGLLELRPTQTYSREIGLPVSRVRTASSSRRRKAAAAASQPVSFPPTVCLPHYGSTQQRHSTSVRRSQTTSLCYLQKRGVSAFRVWQSVRNQEVIDDVPSGDIMNRHAALG